MAHDPADQAGSQVLDLAGMGIVFLHELLDRLPFAAIGIAEKNRDRFLLIEMQLIIFAFRLVVQFITDAPEVVVGRLESGQLLLSDHALLDQFTQ